MIRILVSGCMVAVSLELFLSFRTCTQLFIFISEVVKLTMLIFLVYSPLFWLHSDLEARLSCTHNGRWCDRLTQKGLSQLKSFLQTIGSVWGLSCPYYLCSHKIFLPTIVSIQVRWTLPLVDIWAHRFPIRLSVAANSLLEQGFLVDYEPFHLAYSLVDDCALPKRPIH